MSDTWETVEALIRAGDPGALTKALSQLDAVQRRALVRPMRAFARSDEWGSVPRGTEPLLAIVGVAALPDVRATVAWLRRFQPTWNMISVAQEDRGRGITILRDGVVRALTDRDPTWLPTLVAALVERLRFNLYTTQEYDLIELLRSHLGLPRPSSPPYVAMWFLHDWYSSGRQPNPEMRELLPLLFEEDGIATYLRANTMGWRPTALESLTETDMCDRAAMLDACVARLQRGGRPKATNDFAAVLDELDPAPDEVETHIHDYCALVRPGSAATAAAVAQRALLALDDLGRLDTTTFLDLSRSVLLRSDRKIVRTQLTRLASHADTRPADVDRIVTVVATAFASATSDIQSRAVDLVASVATGLSAPVREAVSALGTVLPSDLRVQLQRALGVAPAPASSAPDDSLLPPTPGPARVASMDTADEAIEELLALLHRGSAAAGGITIERIAEVLLRFAVADPDTLRTAARPLLDHPTYQWLLAPAWPDTGVTRALCMVVASFAGDDWSDRPNPYERDGAVQKALCLRIYELATILRTRPVKSVALPSFDDGSIAADDLVARLRHAVDEGWEPAPLDLEQALLRLDLHGASPEAFAALGTTSADVAASWVRSGGRRAPVVRLQQVPVAGAQQSRPDLRRPSPPPPTVTLATLEPDGSDPAPAGGLWGLMSSLQPPTGGAQLWSGTEPTFDWWPSALPHHRELVAAHLLPELARGRGARTPAAGVLYQLAVSSGDIGDATWAAMAYGLVAWQPDTQAATVDALLALAALDQLDGEALGAILADMSVDGVVVAKRLVGPLGDLAGAGAPHQTWLLLRRFLAGVLPEDPKPTGLPDLLALAVDLVAFAAPGVTIAGLPELAARKGGARQVVEARRLAAALTPGPESA